MWVSKRTTHQWTVPAAILLMALGSTSAAAQMDHFETPSPFAPNGPSFEQPPAPGPGIGTLIPSLDPPAVDPSPPATDSGSGPASGGGTACGDSCPDPNQQVTTIFIAVTCQQLSDSSDDCHNGIEGATQALVDAMQEQAVSNVSGKQIEIHFTSMMDEADQIEELFEIERNAIATTEQIILNQVSHLTPFQQDQSADDRDALVQQHEQQIREISDQARADANGDADWSHNWPAQTHVFQSRAYCQAVQISISGWGGT